MGSFATNRRAIPDIRAVLAAAVLSMALTLGAVTLSGHARAGHTDSPAAACATSAGQA